MQFLLMHQTVVEHDAIGRDILEMYRVLRRTHPCRLFAEYVVNLEEIEQVDANGALTLLADRECVVLYHHSIHWPLGEQLLSGAAGPIIFKYHNITPPEYFSEIPLYRDKCAAGRDQTRRYAERFPGAAWLADSFFNLEDIPLTEEAFYRVVPPFVSDVGKPGEVEPDEKTLRLLLSDQQLHVLFVGRVVPNKGHLFLLDVIHSYRLRYGADIAVHIIGKSDPVCRPYYETFSKKVQNLGLTGVVNLTGEVTSSELLAFFLGCDAYLCCSEHEGFCVPIVESQCLSLPVVARACAAVPETLGHGQLLLGENPDTYADQLHLLRTDEEYRELVIENGRINYFERFTQDQIEAAFCAALSDAGVLA